MSHARLTSRPANREDRAAIYNAGIAERSATFETRPRTPEDIAGWLGGRHPVMVVEEEGRVVATNTRRASASARWASTRSTPR